MFSIKEKRFIAEMERAAEQVRKSAAERMRKVNEAAILREIVRKYPMTAYERKVIPEGVRLYRFISISECRVCEYAYCDHSLNNMFGIDRSVKGRVSVPLICLKDWYKKEEALKLK